MCPNECYRLLDMIKLCPTNEISEAASKGFLVDGKHLFAVKKNGEIFVYANHCPHLGIQLEFMPDQFLDMEGSLIQCAMHGALFRIEDGYCISGPCADQSLQSIPHQIKDDILYALI